MSARPSPTLAMLSTMRELLRLMGVVCWTDRPLSSRGAIMASSGLSTAWTKVVEANLCTHWGTSAGLARQVTSTGMKGLMSLLFRAPQAWFRDLLAAFCAPQHQVLGAVANWLLFMFMVKGAWQREPTRLDKPTHGWQRLWNAACVQAWRCMPDSCKQLHHQAAYLHSSSSLGAHTLTCGLASFMI